MVQPTVWFLCRYPVCLKPRRAACNAPCRLLTAAIKKAATESTAAKPPRKTAMKATTKATTTKSTAKKQVTGEKKQVEEMARQLSGVQMGVEDAMKKGQKHAAAKDRAPAKRGTKKDPIAAMLELNGRQETREESIWERKYMEVLTPVGPRKVPYLFNVETGECKWDRASL